MATLKSYSGINNVQPAQNAGLDELTEALNVDLDLQGKPGRRSGFASDSALAHKNLWEANGFTLATRGAAGDLVNVDSDAVLVGALGHAPRVWYTRFPDGRTAYSNGVSRGMINAAGTAASSWGIALPNLAGVVAGNAVGLLSPGDYQWAITHVRLSDGAESGPSYSAGAVPITTGAISFTGIPVPAGHKANVYLTSRFGGERFLAGSTVNGLFSFAGENKDLVQRCRTEFLHPAPAGKLLAFWRGRALVAVGAALFASSSHGWELFDLFKDFKPFSANLTLVQPVDGGIWVGTERELCFLAGTQWDSLARVVKVAKPVLLGSGCPVPGEHIRFGKDRAQGDCMICIVDGRLVAGAPDGTLIELTLDRYRTEAVEVSASFRMVGDIPQYLAAVP